MKGVSDVCALIEELIELVVADALHGSPLCGLISLSIG